MTWTELHDACEHRDANRIFQVVKENAEQVIQVDDHGWTPLHILCWDPPGIDPIIALLEAHPEAASHQDVHGNSPLHVAVSRPKTDKHLVSVLLSTCPSLISMVNHEGLMPLHMACRYIPQNAGVIGLLIEEDPSALRAHIEMGDPASRKRSTSGSENSIGPGPKDHVPSDPSGGMSKPALSLRYDATVTQIRDGAFPLHMAAEAKAPADVIEMMVKVAPEILLKTNKFGETPLHLALKSRANDDVIEVMLKIAPGATRVREKKHGNMPVHTAAQVGCSVRAAKALLETSPESVHERNAEGMTPLELALAGRQCIDDVLRLFEISNEEC